MAMDSLKQIAVVPLAVLVATSGTFCATPNAATAFGLAIGAMLFGIAEWWREAEKETGEAEKVLVSHFREQDAKVTDLARQVESLKTAVGMKQLGR